MNRYIVTYKDNNGIYHEILVNAKDIGTAEDYITKSKLGMHLIGITDEITEKPGRPEVTVPGTRAN